MTASPAFNRHDFAKFAALGQECFLSIALRCAMNGDRASILEMIRSTADAKSGPLLNADLLLNGVPIGLRLSSSTSLATNDREPMSLNLSLPWLIAVTLRTDPGTEAGCTDRVIYERIFSDPADVFPLPPLRNHWGPEDDAIVRESLQLWKGHSLQGIAQGQFFVALSRFVPSPEFVKVFVDEGLFVSDLFNHKQSFALIGGDVSHRSVDAGTPLAWMLKSGNMQGLADAMRQLEAPSRLSLISPMFVLKHSADNNNVPAKAFQRALQDSPEREAGVLDVLDQIARWEGADTGAEGLWVIRAHVLSDYLRLQTLAHSPVRTPVDPDFVHAMLHYRPQGQPSLAEVLSQRRPEDDVQGPESRSPSRFIVKSLFWNAARAHQAGVLVLAANWLQDTTSDRRGELSPGRLLKLAGECQRPGNAPIDTDAFKATLSVIRDLGQDPLGHFQDHWRDAANGGTAKASQSTLLHAIAQSGVPEARTALLAAMEFGADVKLRDGREWVASSHVTDKAKKAMWLAVEKSFMARQAAQSAIDGIGASARVDTP